MDYKELNKKNERIVVSFAVYVLNAFSECNIISTIDLTDSLGLKPL